MQGIDNTILWVPRIIRATEPHQRSAYRIMRILDRVRHDISCVNLPLHPCVLLYGNENAMERGRDAPRKGMDGWLHTTTYAAENGPVRPSTTNLSKVLEGLVTDLADDHSLSSILGREMWL